MTGCRKRFCALKSQTFAFTLVELLVVIAIIALLLSVSIPGLRKAQMLARRIKCVHNLRQIDLGLQLYLTANNDTYPCAQDPLVSGYWLWMGRGWRKFVEPYLGEKIDSNNPGVLLCPQDKISKEKYESTSYSYSMSFYHSPQQIDSMKSSADCFSNPQPSMPQKITNLKRPAGKILLGEWNSNHFEAKEDKGWWGWDGRRNFLFADSSTHLIKAKEIHPANDNMPDAHLTIGGIKGTDWP